MARKRGEKATKIRAMLEANPDESVDKILKATGAIRSHIYTIRSRMRKTRKPSMAKRIREELDANPDWSADDVAHQVGASKSQVYAIRSKMRKAAGKPNRRGRPPNVKASESRSILSEIEGFAKPGTPGFEVSLKQLTDDLRTIRTMGRDRLNLVLGLLSLFEVTRPKKKETSK